MTSAWQETSNTYLSESAQPAAARFVGFGAGVADANIVQVDEEPPPNLPSATVRWHDFRFYGHVDGLGAVRGSLQHRRPSSVTLRALTDQNLFPAHFYNQLHVSIRPLRRRLLRYENRVPLEVHAASVDSAPPRPGVTAEQFKDNDVFEQIARIPLARRIPFAPAQIEIRDGVQTFLTEGGLEIHDARVDGSRARFAIRNQLGRAVTVAYFVHVTGTHRRSAQDADGLVEVPGDRRTEVGVDLRGLSLRGPNRVVILAIVAAPTQVEGYARAEIPAVAA